eukprot:3421894-Rhodomonas_salina.1
MSGTHFACDAIGITLQAAMRSPRMLLPAHYAKSGTEIAYGAGCTAPERHDPEPPQRHRGALDPRP